MERRLAGPPAFSAEFDGAFALAIVIENRRPARVHAAVRITVDGDELFAATLRNAASAYATPAIAMRAGRPVDVGLHVSQMFRPADYGVAEDRRLGLYLVSLMLLDASGLPLEAFRAQ